MPLSTGAGRSALAALIHSARPLARPLHQLQVAAAGAVEPGVEKLAVAARAPCRSRRSGRLRRRRSRSPARRDIARRPAGSRRPRAATSRARRRPGRGSAAGRSAQAPAWRRARLRSRRDRALRREIDRLDRVGRRHRACRSAAARQRRDAERLPLALLVVGKLAARGNDAQATLLHSKRERARALPARAAARRAKRRARLVRRPTGARGCVTSTQGRDAKSRLRPA